MALLNVTYDGTRPGPVHEWHVHGWTEKTLELLGKKDGPLLTVRLRKRRWKCVQSGRTVHSSPCWDLPYKRLGLDVIVVALGIWLLGELGLHQLELPCHPRTLQRWARALGPHGREWLQTARANIIDHVAPRHLEELLPTGGIPPPAARRMCPDSSFAWRLGEVCWVHENVAQSLHIPLHQLLVVARWRWPGTWP